MNTSKRPFWPRLPSLIWDIWEHPYTLVARNKSVYEGAQTKRQLIRLTAILKTHLILVGPRHSSKDSKASYMDCEFGPKY